jgi:autotransporter-associated beta strand protein
MQTFSGVISGDGRLRRSATVTSDAGTTILTAANTYSGGTVVFAGTLLANNASGSATGSGLVTVSNLGVFGGTGTISGPVLVQTNGAIAPGAGAGTLTLNSGVDLSLSGTYAWELSANSTSGPGVNFDVLAVTGGNLVLDGASRISVNFTGSATAPDAGNPFWQSPRSWTIATIGGSASNPGATKFTTIVNGTYPPGSFTNYTDGGGNVILAFVPNTVIPSPVINPFIVGAGTANATISWSSVNGASYTVQYKTNINQVGWLSLGSVSASGTTASIVDNTGPHRERYYRVMSP